MATTTNYGWTTPDDTALVKDGAAAIRTLGSSVDTTTKNLNPETTLGDIAYRSSTANVKTRLGLGTAGQVLTVNSGANAPEWATPSAPALTTNSATVATLEGTTSQTFTDLTTSGPAVTITTGTKALVIVTSEMISGGLVGCVAGYAVSGATTISATDTTAVRIDETANATGVTSRASAVSRLTSLTAGSNTFTMKYRSTVTARTADFKNREIIVIDLGS
jgi:hypothetical protein